MFENYPRIEYDFITENGTFTREMQDIFRRVSLTDETLANGENYKLYTINDGDTPERIAFEAYDDERLWWVVLLVNNILDVQNEWPKSVTDLTRLFDDFLDGYSYYTMEHLDIQNGDIVVKRDVTADGSIDINTYGVIDSYDSFLHKFNVKNQKASDTKLDDGDEFYIYRRNGDDYAKIGGFGHTACARQSIGSTGCVQILGPTAGYNKSGGVVPNGPLCSTLGSTFGIVRKRTSITDGVKHFEFKGSELNPYSVPNGEGASGDFYISTNQSLCGYTACILYKYIADESIPTYIKTISEGAEMIRNNDDRRVIKLVKPSVVREIVREFQILISSDVPPGTTKYITLNG
tara:strand:+ start:236 stop:1279 length:1044 start_codon:yes stop_codon:yes gene_type:complete